MVMHKGWKIRNRQQSCFESNNSRSISSDLSSALASVAYNAVSITTDPRSPFQKTIPAKLYQPSAHRIHLGGDGDNVNEI